MNFRPRAYIIYYLRPLRLELYGVVVVIAITAMHLCIYIFVRNEHGYVIYCLQSERS